MNIERVFDKTLSTMFKKHRRWRGENQNWYYIVCHEVYNNNSNNVLDSGNI